MDTNTSATEDSEDDDDDYDNFTDIYQGFNVHKYIL